MVGPVDFVSTALGLEGVEKSYGRRRVLSVDALSLEAGDRVLIAGTNGSGKSTLLRLIAGVASPDRGRIIRSAALAGKLGYVPQSGGLYGELSIRENLKLRRLLWRLPPSAPEGMWYVEGLGLHELLDRTPAELSGGFQRLAAVAAALHAEPDWLLLDEPFSGVDAGRRARLVEGLLNVGKTMPLLVVTAPAADEFPEPTLIVEVESGSIRCARR